MQDRSQQIGLTQAERQSEGLCLSTAWKQESAAPPRDVLPAVHTDNTPGSGQSMASARRGRLWTEPRPLACEPCYALAAPARTSTFVHRKSQKTTAAYGTSQLGCATGVLAPDSPKVEGPDPPLLHPLVAKEGGRWVQRNGTWSNKRQHESCNYMHECIDNTRCICALFCFARTNSLSLQMINNDKF